MKIRTGMIVVLLLAGAAPLSLAAQAMADVSVEKEAAQASHRGTGKVVSVDRARLQIKLAHEPIKTLGWPGMTMDFGVANASLLDGLKEGDNVQFELGKIKPEAGWVLVKIERK